MSSRRTLPLPAVAYAALSAHRAQQQREKVRPGPPWQRLVFVTAGGTQIEGSHVVRAMHRIRAAQLPDTRFHDLRHSAASLLFAQGVPAKTVQEILGHSRISTTLLVLDSPVADRACRHLLARGSRVVPRNPSPGESVARRAQPKNNW